MRCPYCSGKSKVLDSQECGDSRIRWRECKDCGRDFYTREAVTDYAMARVVKNIVRDEVRYGNKTADNRG